MTYPRPGQGACSGSFPFQETESAPCKLISCYFLLYFRAGRSIGGPSGLLGEGPSADPGGGGGGVGGCGGGGGGREGAEGPRQGVSGGGRPRIVSGIRTSDCRACSGPDATLLGMKGSPLTRASAIACRAIESGVSGCSCCRILGEDRRDPLASHTGRCRTIWR
jgi:hypothetical protein